MFKIRGVALQFDSYASITCRSQAVQYHRAQVGQDSGSLSRRAVILFLVHIAHVMIPVCHRPVTTDGHLAGSSAQDGGADPPRRLRFTAAIPAASAVARAIRSTPARPESHSIFPPPRHVPAQLGPAAVGRFSAIADIEVRRWVGRLQVAFLPFAHRCPRMSSLTVGECVLPTLCGRWSLPNMSGGFRSPPVIRTRVLPVKSSAGAAVKADIRLQFANDCFRG